MAMQDQVAEFVSRVIATVLRGFVPIQKNEWSRIFPERERIDLAGVDRQRKNSDTLRLEKVNHVPDGQFADAPMPPQRVCRRFGRTFAAQIRECGLGQFESRLEPFAQVQRDSALTERHVALRGGHLREGAKARSVGLRFVEIVAVEEIEWELRGCGETPGSFRLRWIISSFVCGDGSEVDSRSLCEFGFG